MTDYAALGQKIGELVQSKQRVYGDSFGKAGDILSILYPNGVGVDQYDDMLAITRVIDKLFRIATDRDALGESPWGDIAGYALLAVARITPAPELPDEFEITYTKGSPMCLVCGVNVIPENRTMFCSDECMMPLYPNYNDVSKRWEQGEGRHSQPWDISKKP